MRRCRPDKIDTIHRAIAAVAQLAPLVSAFAAALVAGHGLDGCRSLSFGVVAVDFGAFDPGASLPLLLFLITDFIWTTSRRTLRITARGLPGS
jgi:hypothetical protein